MTEKQIKKLEKKIAGGVVRFMLFKGFQQAALAALVFLFAHLLYSFDVLKWKPFKLRETIVIVIGFFVAGCLSSFTDWDSLIETHKKAIAQENKMDSLTPQANQ